MPAPQVRNETDLFLNNSPGSRAYTPKAVHDAPPSEYIQSDEHSLTGAARPILPLRMAIGKKNGERLEFTMLISPNNLNHGKTNATSSAYTRLGWINQLWGPNQDVLTATGRTAVFMAPKAGVTTFYRKQSFGFLNFMAMVNTYKSNGYQIMDPTQARDVVEVANSRVINVVNGVEISYDNDIFTGHFNTFTLDEAVESPFTFSYNFEFIISSLNRDFREVRGHFSPIPERETLSEPESSVLLDDVFGSGGRPKPANPVRQSRTRNEQSVYRLWEIQTGLPWSEAINGGYTDGSPKQNLQLRGKLLAGEVTI